jgi:hypothetical protein
MKHVLILLISFFSLSVFSNDLDEKIKKFEEEIKTKFGIEISKNDSLARTSRSNYLSFLSAFKERAIELKLEDVFIPTLIKISVKEENWNMFDSHPFKADIECIKNCMNVGHRSATETVDKFVELFAKKGTQKAQELDIRNKAVRRAILEKMRFLKDSNVSVRTFFFTVDATDLDTDLTNLDYFRQELLLQGLINLEKRVKAKKESRAVILLCTIKAEDSWEECDKWGWADDWAKDAEIRRYIEIIKKEESDKEASQQAINIYDSSRDESKQDDNLEKLKYFRIYKRY